MVTNVRHYWSSVLTRYRVVSAHDSEDSSRPMLLHTHMQEPVVVLVCINHGMDGLIITT